MTATLEFICGRAGTGKTTACLAAMQQRMAEAPLGPALILLLPEHMTFQVERQLAGMMQAQGKGFVRSYVFGFRRFARQVLLETGGAVLPRISDIGRRLLLKRILHRRQKELTVFARAAGRHGFTQALSEALEEAKSYGLTPEILQQAATELGEQEPYLAGKLQDIALLATDFTQAMAGHAEEAGDQLTKLVERIPDSQLLAGAEVWLDGFVFFNPQERAIIAALLQKVKVVHVTLAMEPDYRHPANQDSGLFYRSAQTYASLHKLAEELQAPVRERSLQAAPSGRGAAEWQGAPRFCQPALAHIERALFHFPLQAQQAAGGLRIVETANARLEMTSMAADILRLCREQGYHWRDIGVLVRDNGYYTEQLRLLLPHYGIPYFMDAKRESTQHPLAELLRSVFDALRGWRGEPVCRCLRTGFWSQLSLDAIDQLENYARAFGVRGRQAWLQEQPWDWREYRSLESETEQSLEEKQRLAQIDAWRRIAAQPLALLQDSLHAAKTVREQTQALYNFLLALEVPDTLAQWAERATQAVTQGLPGQTGGETQQAAASEQRQLWQKLMELFDQLVMVAGDEQMSLREYELVLADGLDALQLAVIPQGLDAVTIADFDQNSLQGFRAIYILGANAGVMPRDVVESGLLTDADRLHLREKAKLEIPAGSRERSFSENYLLYRSFTEARDYLWVSYALADTQGGELLPSPLIARLRTILPQVKFLSLTGMGSMREDDLRLAAPWPALAGLTDALREQRDNGRWQPFWQDVYNWCQGQQELRTAMQLSLRGLWSRQRENTLPEPLARALFARYGRLHGSVTQFEHFHACPFQYFAQHGLRLRERPEWTFRPLELGDLLHGVMHTFGEELRQAGRRWSEVGDDECALLCQRAVQELAPRVRGQMMLREKPYAHLLTRIQHTAEQNIHRLIAFDKASQFHPLMFEQTFGEAQDALPPLSYQVGDVQVELTGKIDRLDLSEDGRYFLVIDYKTGQAAINLLEVWYGLRMQLLAYLLVAQQALQKDYPGCLPAGVLYCFLKDMLLSTESRRSREEVEAGLREKLQMPGWVLAEPEVIKAIDPQQHFIKVQLGKDDKLPSRQTAIKSEAQFALLLDYVGFLVQDTGRRILHGDIAAHPYRSKDGNACTFCFYRDLCGFDPTLGDNWADLPDDSKDEEIYARMRAAMGGKELAES